jgi:DMSO reductase anchor subunit
MTDTAGHRPLVVFTGLAIAGAGLVSASALAYAVQGVMTAGTMTAGAVLLASGLAVSFGHLGQRRRAALAARGVGRSALSNEAVVAGGAAGLAAIAAGLAWAGAPAGGVVIAAGVVNLLFLLSVGLVYRLKGQLTWQGISVLTPLTGGLAFGTVVLASLAGGPGDSRLALLIVSIDGLVFSRRWREVVAIPFSPAMLADPWQRSRSPLLAARLFLLNVVPFAVLAAAPTPVAAVAAALGVAADRIGFYALALQQTTGREVAAVEALIEELGRRGDE